MGDKAERIIKFAASEGYELAHYGESAGDGQAVGVIILVRMTERRVCDTDMGNAYKAATELRRALDRVTAERDPKGPGLRRMYRDQIERIYQAACVTPIYIEELPNRYSPEEYNRPWYRVTSSIGHIVLGWRRHVMNVDWEHTVVRLKGEELFAGEGTTCGDTFIHARGEENAARYVRRLHEAAARGNTCADCGRPEQGNRHGLGVCYFGG